MGTGTVAPQGRRFFVVKPRKSLPLGGKVARYAPDEGELSGSYPLISHLR